MDSHRNEKRDWLTMDAVISMLGYGDTRRNDGHHYYTADQIGCHTSTKSKPSLSISVGANPSGDGIRVHCRSCRDRRPFDRLLEMWRGPNPRLNYDKTSNTPAVHKFTSNKPYNKSPIDGQDCSYCIDESNHTKGVKCYHYPGWITKNIIINRCERCGTELLEHEIDRMLCDECE